MVDRTDDGTQDKGRRGFLIALGAIGLAWLGAGLWPVYRYLGPRPVSDPFAKGGRVKVDKITPADVAQPGMGKNGAYDDHGLILFRAPDGTLRAFDSKCTHAGCNVQFEGSRLHCPCHGGTYNLEGVNIAGPPPRPLTRLAVSEQPDGLYVSKYQAGK